MKSIISILLLLPRLAHQQFAMLEQTFNVSKLQPYSFQLSDDKTHLQDSDQFQFPFSFKQLVKCESKCQSIPFQTDKFEANIYYSSNVIAKNFFYNIMALNTETKYQFVNWLSESHMNKTMSKQITQGCIFTTNSTDKYQVTLLTLANPQNESTVQCGPISGNKFCPIKEFYQAIIQTTSYQFISLLTFMCDAFNSEKYQDLITQSTKLMEMMSKIRTKFEENDDKTCYSSFCNICTDDVKTFCLACSQAEFFSSKANQPCGYCSNNTECEKVNTQMQQYGQIPSNSQPDSVEISLNSSLPSSLKANSSCSSDHYYDTNSSTCAICSSECLTCQNALDCSSCTENKFLDISSKKCYEILDLQIFEDKTCNGSLVQADVSPNSNDILNKMIKSCKSNLKRKDKKYPLDLPLGSNLQICVRSPAIKGGFEFELNCTFSTLKFGWQVKRISLPNPKPSNSTNTTSITMSSTKSLPMLSSASLQNIVASSLEDSNNSVQSPNETLHQINEISNSYESTLALDQSNSQTPLPQDKTVNQSTIFSNETSQMSASPTQYRSDSHSLQNATISEIMQYMAQKDEKSSPTTAKIHKFMNNSYQDLSNRSTIVGQVSYAMRYVPFWSLLTNYPYWLCYFQLMKLHTMYHVEATENLISMWVFKGAKNKMVQNILPIDANYIYNNSDIDPVQNQLGLTPIFVYSNNNVILIITLLLIFKGIMALIQKTHFDPSEQSSQDLLIQEITDQQKMLISNLYEQDVSRIRLLRDRLVYSTLDQAYLCSMISLLLMLKHPKYDGAFEIISIIIAICYLLFFIGVNGKAYYRIRQIISIINHFKFTNHQAYDLLVMKTRSVFRYQLMDLDLSLNANYYYHLLTYGKKTIMVLVVFYINDEYGMNILFLIQVAILYALFHMRPYKKKIKQYLYTIVNLTFLFVILLKLFLSLDIYRYIREPSKSALNDCRSLGWVVVCMELIGLGLTIFYTLIGMCETISRVICKKQTQTQQPTLGEEV